ncbi:hypothetical protein LTR17_006479 [Elasticomyces elasticus]|nr:hypothetical protein LTR17_006479 [Elasticomyces elasticus]
MAATQGVDGFSSLAVKAPPPASNADSAAPITQSSTFLTIPPEIRNDIYELVFNQIWTGDTVDLMKAVPPSKAPLLACHQMFNEAKGLHKTAYRGYWSEVHFTICIPEQQHEHLSRDQVFAEAKFTIARNALLPSSRVHFTASDLLTIRHIHFTTSIHELSRLRKYSHNIDFIEEIGSFGHNVRFERRKPETDSLCDVIWCPIGPDRTSSQIIMSVSRGKYSFGRALPVACKNEGTLNGMMTRGELRDMLGHDVQLKAE